MMTTISWCAIVCATIFVPGLAGCEKAPQPRKSSHHLGQKYRDAFEKLAVESEGEIAKNPQDGNAHAAAAEMYATLWCFGYLPRDETLPKARAAAEKAVALDHESATARTALGIVRMCNWDWSAAEQEFARAVELDPNNAKAHHWNALFLAAMGRRQEALAETDLACAAEPDSLGYQTGKGAVLYFGRDFEAMRTHMITTSAQDPTFPWAYDWLGMAFVQLEDFPRAIEVYQKAVRLSDDTAEVLAGLGHAYGLADETAAAQAILDRLERHAELEHVPPVQRAYVCIGLGLNDRAFELLNEAYNERSWELVFLREEPWFDPIRNDNRFAQLLQRMKFPEATHK